MDDPTNVIKFPRGFRYPPDHPLAERAANPEVSECTLLPDVDVTYIEPDEAIDTGATPIGGKALAYRLSNLLRLANATLDSSRRDQYRCAAANAIFQGLRLKRTDPVEYLVYKNTLDALVKKHFPSRVSQVSDSLDI